METKVTGAKSKLLAL